MASGGSKYFQISPGRRRDTGNDVSRGLEVGQTIGKLLGGLGGAIQTAQKNALANRLMDEASIGDQPGAGVTQSLGKLESDSGDATQLGTAPPQTFTNPSSGNVEPLQGPDTSNTDLAQAVAAARLGGSANAPTVGSEPQAASGGTDFNLNPSDYSAGGTAFGDKGTAAGSVGGLIHTGGTQELDLQKEMLAQRIQKASLAKSAAETADAQAEAAGTGKYALQAIKERLGIAKTEAEIRNLNKPEKEDKNAPAVNIDSEPVRDQNQLVRHVDEQYGKGTYDKLIAAVSDGSIDPSEVEVEEKNPDGTLRKNPDGTVIITRKPGKSVPLVISKDANGIAKEIKNIPIDEVKTYIRQTNLQRLQNGLPAFRVPGENQEVGKTKDNPFIAHNKMEILSRVPGTYVQLPNGRIVIAEGPKRIRR